MAGGAEGILDPFVAAADKVAPGRFSAVLYGSAARGDYFPATSNVNLLLVLDDVEPATLRALGPAIAAWRAATPEPPLLISRAEWARATDVFPLEITDMLVAYRVLRGSDPLAGMQVLRSDLRRSLETELRGKLLRLRQGYAALSGNPADLGALALRSAPSALAFFRTLLALEEKPIARAADAERTVRDAAGLVGFEPDSVLEVVRRRGQREWSLEPAVFERYMDAVARTAIVVDHLKPGDD